MEEQLLHYSEIHEVDDAVAVEVGVLVVGKKDALQLTEVDHVNGPIVVEVGIAAVAIAIGVRVPLAGVRYIDAVVA